MSTPSTEPTRSNDSFGTQVTKALQAAGAVVVMRCPTCGDWHEGACPWANAGASTPFVATISDQPPTIPDGVWYDAPAKPDFVTRDNEGWREL